jgi:thiosulfate dehydrogenase (quinone) large subunit
MNLPGLSRFETVYARVALAGGFLTSVTDRFGLWGPAGSKNVAWGDMQHFLTYTAVLNPWFPGAAIPAVGILVTALETGLAILLLVGFQTRMAAKISTWLTIGFAIGMAAGTGIKSALNASVIAFSACAWLLAKAEWYPLSFDAVRKVSKSHAWVA